MKAIVCSKYGPAEVLQLREVDKPAPKKDEVLIKIVATTVTSGDVRLRSLTGISKLIFSRAFGLGKNPILGHEFSGEIEGIGEDATQFKIGDQVFGITGPGGGAYAEYISLSEAGMVAIKPTNLTYEQAAAVPIGANTALYFIKEGNIQKGQQVLIYGASGSVGTYAVQLARHYGAEVSGVCSTANVELVRSLGAVKVIDYTLGDFAGSGESYDVVFDAVGKISSVSSKKVLKANGTLLSVKSPTKDYRENLLAIKELIEAGRIKPVIDKRYSLEEIVEAHRYVEKGHKKGNVVITVAQPN